MNKVYKGNTINLKQGKSIEELYGVTKADFQSLLINWFNQKSKYLVINYQKIKGLSIRLYIQKFSMGKSKVTLMNYCDAGTVYYRRRCHETKKFIMQSLGAFDVYKSNTYPEQLPHLLERYDPSNNSDENIECDNGCLTLREMIDSQYLEYLNEINPKSSNKKVKVIYRYFGDLLDCSLRSIDSRKVKLWLKTIERKLTNKQLVAGEEQYSIKPSTIKEAIGTLRTAMNYAKEQGLILEHDLYQLPSFKSDTEIVRYLTVDEEKSLYNAINQRNSSLIQQRRNTIEHRRKRNLPEPNCLKSCYFADHVMPYILLFKETGIRPGTISNAKWSDINFESRYFKIRKEIDKKNKENYIPLNDLALNVLVEWKKHHIHEDCLKLVGDHLNTWIFPSPRDPKTQLLSIKSAWDTIRKKANIQNFRFYDLRHDFASKVMLNTGNIYLVSHLLNHRQIETTKRYAHLMDKSVIDAVKLLDKNRVPNTLPNFIRD